MSMTMEQFTRAFPNRAFGVLRVERGEGSDRKLGWLADFTSQYFTSDTDRLAGRNDFGAGAWGETMEAALDALAKREVAQCEANRAAYAKGLRAAEEELRAVQACIEEAKQ